MRKGKLIVMKKNIVTVAILVVTIMFSFRCFASSPQELTSNQQCSLDIMRELGIINEMPTEEQLSSAVSRLEFSKYVAYMLNLNKEVASQKYFTDVSANSIANVLASAGIVNGSGDGTFNPDAPVSQQEAIIMIMRAAGYDDYIKASGGKPNDYVRFAKKYELINSFDGIEKMTLYDVLDLFFNACKMKTYNIIGAKTSGGGSGLQFIYEQNGDALLEVYHDIYYVEGRMVANEYTQLHSANTDTLSKEEVMIDNQKYSFLNEDINDFIGINVKGFYKLAQSNKKTIITLAADEEQNKTVTINLYDVTDYSYYTLTYYENDKVKKITFPKSVSLIYNGRAPSGNYEKYIPVNGTGVITVLSDSSGNYDCIKVEEFIMAKVTGVNNSKKILYTDNPNIKAIDLNDDGQKHTEMRSSTTNLKLSLQLVEIGEFVSAAISDDGMYVKVYVDAQIAKGTVEKFDSDNCTAFVNGTEYHVNRNKMDDMDITVGMSYVFYANKYGEIIGVGYKQQEDIQAAYILKAAPKDNNMKTKYMVKMFTEDNEAVTYFINDTVKVDGIKVDAKSAYNTICPGGTLKRQLIKYSTNKDGYINYIDTAANSAESTENFGTLWEQTNDVTKSDWKENVRMILPSYPVWAKTKVFVVPPQTETVINEKNLAVVDYRVEHLFYNSNNQPYSLQCYKTNPDHPYTDYVVYYYDVEPVFETFPLAVVVDEVSKTINSAGEECVVIQGYTDYIHVTLTVDENCDVSDVEKGDVVRYMTNATGSIVRTQLLYDRDKNITSWGNTYWNSFFRFADVIKVDQNYSNPNEYLIKIGYVPDDIREQFNVLTTSNPKFMIYDSKSKNGELYIGNVTDITDYYSDNVNYDKVFIMVSGPVDYQYDLIVIYK